MNIQVASIFLVLLIPFDGNWAQQPTQDEQPHGQQDELQTAASRQDAPPARAEFEMRILALFTGSANDLGLDHRLGRQVLKLAADKARRLSPGLTNLELLFYNDDFDCSGNLSHAGNVPIWVAENFYLGANGEQVVGGYSTGGQAESSGLGASSDVPGDEGLLERGGAFALVSNEPEQCQGRCAPETVARIDAILGPSCDHQIDQVARMAAYWRVPIYIVTPTSGSFAHKEIYSTMTRVAPSIDHLSEFMVSLLEHFKWRHLALVVDLSQSENSILVKSLDRTIEQLRYSTNIERHLFSVESNSLRVAVPKLANGTSGEGLSRCTPRASEILDQVRRVARIVLILLNDPRLVRSLLLCAHEMQLNSGEFVFLTVNLGFKAGQKIASQEGSTRGGGPTGGARQTAQVFEWFEPDDGEDNLRARQMFESLMVFSVEMPIEDELNLFAEQTLDMARREFPSESSRFESVGPIGVALHDSLLLAVEAKRRHLFGLAGGNLSRRTRLMWNSTYSPGLMTNMKINANGDQELDYVLSDLEPELGIMRPVASFSRQTRQLNFYSNSYIHWPALRPSSSILMGLASSSSAADSFDPQQASASTANSDGEPPPDEPECGFTGEAERCVDRRNMYTALTIISLFLLSVLIILAINFGRYRKIKYQMQLDDYWWRINWSDLEVIDWYSNSLHSKLGSNSVVCLKQRAKFTTAGSVVSSGKQSLASGVLQAAVVSPSKQHSQQPRPSRSFIAENLLKAIKRPAASEDEQQHQNLVSLVVTPAASSPDELRNDEQASGGGEAPGKSAKSEQALETHRRQDATDRLSLASGGSRSKLRTGAPSIGLTSDLSAVVRSSSLALYKDEVVIVKQLNCQSIEISRELLVELKSIRELAHENLAQLVGLCIERNHVASVYVYCSRGNLQDLLLNDQFHMDWDLKYSIIGDLLNGLNYIHTTLLDFHGRLKSTNLVIDSRFTVKLTDFGLKSLYKQLDLIEPPDDESDEGDGGGQRRQQQQQHENQVGDRRRTTTTTASSGRDSLHGDEFEFRGRCQSAAASVYNMDSVSMRAENLSMPASFGKGQRQPAADSSNEPPTRSLNPNRMQMKNRSAARFFWTAPEHLRQRQPHLAASAKGDVYSLGIILYEIFTRKEPYYFGTNARPRWHVIRREKLRHRQAQPAGNQYQQQQSVTAASLDGQGRRTSQLMRKPPGWRRRSNQVADQQVAVTLDRKVSLGGQSDHSDISVRSFKSVLRATRQAAAPPSADNEHDTERCDTSTQVSRSSEGTRNSRGIKEAPSSGRVAGGGAGRTAPTSGRISMGGRGGPRAGRAQESQQELPVVVDLELEEPTDGGPEGEAAGELATAAAGARSAASRLDADEVLDQLRMGIKPEPIRPYIPNFLLADIEPKLVDLLRACWHESPNLRPNAAQVRSSMRKITRGATARNYLDNLLDRLQTYANQLERIVDFRSADILAEKMRTEELLYQLVPRFVADKLKQNEPVIPQLYEGVTIFFSDIVGFEKYASVMSPCEMVDLLNNINSSFEDIIRSFDVTKIEVILDQFLVAAGISLGGSERQHQTRATASGERADQEACEQPVGPVQQQQQRRDARSDSKTATKNRKKLLSSFRRSGDRESLDDSRERAKVLQRKQESLGESLESRPEATLTDEAAASSEAELYKRSGAEQIARMALCIRDLVKSFHFRQNLSTCRSSTGDTGPPGKPLEYSQAAAQEAKTGADCATSFVATTFNIRIGIHSGKVCAGLVGQKRPKFCLIGDAVNVASRMHTNSKANKIQISPDTRELLKHVSGFSIVSRGRIEIKGKGLMETFWLESAF